MSTFNIGDVVARRSYGGDVYFTVVDVIKENDGRTVYRLKGQTYRIEADSREEDLVRLNIRHAQMNRDKFRMMAEKRTSRCAQTSGLWIMSRARMRTGRILHLDSSEDFLELCLKHYRKLNLRPIGIQSAENEQPGIVRELLERNQPDILVMTGHDGLKKDYGSLNSVDSYRNSRYFIQSVREARQYESSFDKLSIFAGACQSYYEGIMGAGANFASSPGRVLINALDPAYVAQRIALTENTKMVTARDLAGITVSGAKGIGGIDTKGHMYME